MSSGILASLAGLGQGIGPSLQKPAETASFADYGPTAAQATNLINVNPFGNGGIGDLLTALNASGSFNGGLGVTIPNPIINSVPSGFRTGNPSFSSTVEQAGFNPLFLIIGGGALLTLFIVRRNRG